jgi:hypothetical protein
MAIMDGKNTFSDLALGDAYAAIGFTVTDNPSTYAIDCGVNGASYSTVANGGAYVNPFLVSRVTTAFTSASTTITLQVVLQESVDNSTYTDVLVSPVYVKADLATDNKILLAVRMPQIKKRYIRVAYRVAGEAATAGAIQSFLCLDTDMQDLFMRSDTQTVTEPTGAMNHASGVAVTGILDS